MLRVGSASMFRLGPTEVVQAPRREMCQTYASFAEAAALPLVGLTALQSLVHDNGLCQGQHLLVIGASGGVGHVACQLAKAVGAAVTAVCSARNHDLNICTYVPIC